MILHAGTSTGQLGSEDGHLNEQSIDEMLVLVHNELITPCLRFNDGVKALSASAGHARSVRDHNVAEARVRTARRKSQRALLRGDHARSVAPAANTVCDPLVLPLRHQSAFATDEIACKEFNS